jgi:zinc protease
MTEVTAKLSQDGRQYAPAPLSAIAFDIPQPYRTTLDNGLRIVLFPDDRLPLVSYRLAFNVGDAQDPADQSGLTSAMAALLTEGTANYTSRQLAERVERLGASLSASASDDFTIVAGSALSLYTDEILEMMSECVLKPTFPEDELDLYRRNTVEHLKFQRSQPPFLAGEQASRLIYGKHPYAVVSPKAAHIEQLEREALRSYHAKALVPNNAVFIAVGDIDQEELTDQLRERFAQWAPGGVEKFVDPPPPQRSERTLTIVDRPGSTQSNIILGNLAIHRTHPDYFPVLVMNQVLGAGASSRVFMNLREEKGYTYGAYTRLNTKRAAGDIEATAEVRNEVTGDSLREFFYELGRIRTERVGDEELGDAKNFLTGVFPIRAETQEGLTNLIVNQELYGLPDDYLQTYRENVDRVTADEVERVANEHIRPDEMAMVIVGDAREVRPQAEQYASFVEVLDTEGNPK